MNSSAFRDKENVERLRGNGDYTRMKSQWWLYTAVLVALLPLVFLRDFTPSNELRYLSIADESLHTGRWWAFTNHGLAYADKPPLYLWIVMLGKWLFGSHQMWFLSLFSVIPAFVVTEVMNRWTFRLMKPEFRIVAAMMLLSCGLFLGMCIVLRMDMLMTMFIVLALRRFEILMQTEGRASLKSRLLFPIWIFLAVFSKGPMGILIPLVATTVYLWQQHRLRTWGFYWGWLTWGVLLILCAGWFGAVYAEGGTEYLDNLLVKQTVGRGVNSFHHKAPVWYYLTSLPYTLLPWTFLIIGSIVVSIMRRKKESSATERYFVTIILSTLVLLSLISSKIQVYMLPAYPFMVYVAALVSSRHSHSRYAALAVMIPVCMLAIAGIAAGILWLNLDGASRRWWMLVEAAILLVGTTAAYWWLYCSRNLRAAAFSLGATLLALVFAAGFAVQEFNPDLGYRALAGKGSEVSAANGNAPIICLDLNRPENMDVYFGERTFRIEESQDGERFVPGEKCVLLIDAENVGNVDGIKEEWPVGRKYKVVLALPFTDE